MYIPMPDGRMASFRVWESSIQEPALEAKFPEIRTFAGQGIDDPYATIRFDYTPRGFHAQVLTPGNTYYIDPYAVGNTTDYISYFRRDNPKSSVFHCDVSECGNTNRLLNVAAPCRGTDLRTYRLAVACTGEYAQAPGIAAGTNPAILHAAIVTTVNRVVGVYELELAIRMVLVANNNIIEYLNAATDPFNGNNNANTLINESQSVITTNIGTANFDIGHTFSTGGGGLAGLGVVCNNTQKGRGITGSPSPTGDAYDIDYVAHEMGHQFGGNHPMNGCGASPNSTKYEPGSGTTIMAYAGICGGQDIQPNSDPTFHAISFDEISNYLTGTGGSCGVLTPTGNTLPVIDALTNNNLSIPPSTPFTLTGSATDANGDALTYCWEEWDLGSPGAGWNAGLTGAAGNTIPLFKSRLPKTNGSRTFPDIAVILAGFPANPPAAMGGLKGEVLSPVARPMKFKLTVRDNRAAGGGVASSGTDGCQSASIFQVNVVGTSPFTVAAPNGGELWAGGSTQTVTWNVVGTNAAPVNVANVKISLSTDGGLTYPTVVLASTANDGTESITVPSLPTTTTTCRIKVEAIGNIFFDISNSNFTIDVPPAGFTFSNPAAGNITCGTSTSANVTLATTAFGGFSTPINLTATGNPGGTTVSFAPNPLAPGNSTVVTLSNTNTLTPGTYNITVTGTAGTSVQTQTVSYIVAPGTAPAITSQPVNNTVCAGETANFSVAATGSGLSYQWQVSTDGGTTYTNIAGATSTTFSIASAASTQNGYLYHVIVSALCGSSTSNAATLTVNAAPGIATQPADATVCAGSNNTFAVTGSGGGLNYQWQISTDGGTTFTNIAGANSASYTLSGITIAQNGYQYHVIVTGACPGSVTSNNVTLTVGNAPSITAQPADLTACEGTAANFSVTASGSGLSYQWQVSTDGGGTYTDISGATSATYSVTAATTLNGYRYRVIVTSASCATPSTSNAAILTVNALPAITTQPASATLCAGSSVTFTAAATGTAIAYQWQLSTDGGTTFTDIAGATSATYSIAATSASQNGYQYHVVVSGTCSPAATSANATLNVVSPASVTTQPTNTAVCDGANASFSVTGASASIYQWQVSTNGGTSYTNIAGATSATLSLSAVTTASNGNLYQVLLSNSTCTSPVTSTAAALTVNALPNVTAQASETNVCTGTPVTLSATGASTYSWNPGSLNGATVVVNPSVVNPSIPNTITYTVTGTDANGCVSNADVDVTANPLPTVTLTATPANTSLLPGRSVTLRATVTPSAGFTFVWRKNGVIIPNTTDSLVVTVEDVGAYTVEAADAGGFCNRTSDELIVRDSITNTIFIWPNPNDGNFTVSYYNYIRNVNQSRNNSITIFDVRGARIYNKTYTVNQGYNLMKVNLRGVAAGPYIVVLRDGYGNKIAAERIFVQP